MSFLRYELMSSADNVLWAPLSRWSRDKVDAVRDALIEAEERESTDPAEWLGVYDHKRKSVVWKLGPTSRTVHPTKKGT